MHAHLHLPPITRVVNGIGANAMANTIWQPMQIGRHQMLDVTSAKSRRVLSVNETDLARRKRIAGLDQDDLERIVSLKELLVSRADHYGEVFFNHLDKIGAAPELFAKRAVLDQARQRKREHLLALANGRYDCEYVEQRVDLATLYGEHGVETVAILGAYQKMLQTIARDVFDRLRTNPMDAFEKYMSITKAGCLDLSVISDTIIATRERIIGLQQQAIRELSTPVLQVRDRLLILPIIGVLDSQRAKQLTSDLLSAIRTCRCKIVVMDITGVAAVDSKVANHLIQTISAARLMGSAVIITGVTADVAQALVALGIDLGGIDTTSDLQSGLEQAERDLGYRVVGADEAAA
jgi:rsbT co-antagonist protein RsbR